MVLMEEIRHQLIGSVFHYYILLFIGLSSINAMSTRFPPQNHSVELHLLADCIVLVPEAKSRGVKCSLCLKVAFCFLRLLFTSHTDKLFSFCSALPTTKVSNISTTHTTVQFWNRKQEQTCYNCLSRYFMISSDFLWFDDLYHYS